MILTPIISGNDGLGLSVDKAGAILAEMYGAYLERDDRIEVLEVDDLAILQRGATAVCHRGAPLDHAGRVYMLSNMSTCPQREQKLHTLYHLLLELGAALLNRSFAASPELEVNKTIMHAVVAQLGIPCIPTMELDARASVSDVLARVAAAGFAFPLLLKPNRLMMGAGIMLCESPDDFSVKAGIVRQLSGGYLIQEFVPNSGDLRVYLSRETIFGHQLRQPKPGDLRSNVSIGARSIQIELPRVFVEQCLAIARRCDADYLALDWLRTESGFVFNELCSTMAGFAAVPPALREPMARAVLGIARQKLRAVRP